MHLSISFVEVRELVRKYTAEEIEVSQISSNSAGILYTKRVGPFAPTLKAQVRIEGVVGTKVRCSFDGDVGARAAWKLLRWTMKKRLVTFLRFQGEDRLEVDLASIEQWNDVLRYVAVTGIHFSNDSVVLDARMVE
ncbi:MAG: hypothetical protein SPJ13_02710 [Bacteroidales bacterium]|nr:hypothetical protein [Bacteroidales bacterium]